MYNKWTGTFVTPSPPSVSPGAVVNGTGLQHRLCVFESAIGTVLWLLALVSTNGQRATFSADTYRCVKAKAKMARDQTVNDSRKLVRKTNAAILWHPSRYNAGKREQRKWYRAEHICSHGNFCNKSRDSSR